MFSDHPRVRRWSPKNDVDVDTVSMNSHKSFGSIVMYVITVSKNPQMK